MKIGMFDSGVGGISVLHQAMRRVPAPEYLYYADEAHAPYGTKETALIRMYAEQITSFLLERGAECIVIACNTATSAAVASIREQVSVPVVGMEPAVKPALQLAPDGDRNRVLVLATPLTIREHKLEDLIGRYDETHRVDLKALPYLVELAEKGVFDEDRTEAYLREALADIDVTRYRAVVPGCTHFHYFLPQLKRFFPAGTDFVDGHAGTIRRMADVCGLQETPGRACKVTYYVSGEEVTGGAAQARIEALHARLDAIAPHTGDT